MKQNRVLDSIHRIDFKVNCKCSVECTCVKEIEETVKHYKNLKTITVDYAGKDNYVFIPFNAREILRNNHQMKFIRCNYPQLDDTVEAIICSRANNGNTMHLQYEEDGKTIAKDVMRIDVSFP